MTTTSYGPDVIFERQAGSAVSRNSGEPIPSGKGFGSVFTDHMVRIGYRAGEGWHGARVERFGSVTVSPAAAVLHYGQAIFEGLKAYRAPDDRVLLFRPDANAARFQRSARRLAMPEMPSELFVRAVEELVAADRGWVPPTDRGSLYLRPFMVATEPFLGMRPAEEYLFCVIASPAGGVFSGGSGAISVDVCHDYSRAAAGGTGSAKCAGNYAASLPALHRALSSGYDQVVFLDAARQADVEELGGMNIFFVFRDGRITTPPLRDTVLAGVTRDSVIALAGAAGHPVVEAPYTIEQWRADATNGRLSEVFACGTAATIVGIDRVRHRDAEFTVGDGGAGPITARLRTQLLDLQYGRAADVRNWVRAVP
ncbi:branched-chain amino acid aminotransferase [Plantactinospora sp. WMMB334]|uniref:branched-chain amino acid aminotransferase n=1 Tax=Plantactinospora sp. WMMB334 TaxID=3404119 RepID=UPI003B941E52